MTATDSATAAALAALHAALDVDASDVVTRLVLADALEDVGGRRTSAAQRWQAAAGKWPNFGGSGEWRWWRGLAPPAVRDDPADLPPAVFDRLAAGDHRLASGRYYPSRRDAEADLAAALESLAMTEGGVT